MKNFQPTKKSRQWSDAAVLKKWSPDAQPQPLSTVWGCARDADSWTPPRACRTRSLGAQGAVLPQALQVFRCALKFENRWPKDHLCTITQTSLPITSWPISYTCLLKIAQANHKRHDSSALNVIYTESVHVNSPSLSSHPHPLPFNLTSHF